MSKIVHTTYHCDNERYCSSEAEGSRGLPVGWFAMTRQVDAGGSQKHWHFCSPRCLQETVEESDDD